MALKTSVLSAVAAAALLAGAAPSMAAEPDVVQNGAFQQNGASAAETLSASNPAIGFGWSTYHTGLGPWLATGDGSYSFVTLPGANPLGPTNIGGTTDHVINNYPSGAGYPFLPPAGSNVYIADVGPGYYQSQYLFQKISDLNVGATYDVSFWQAGANFTDASGTVAQWLVSLSGAPQYSIEPGSGSNAVTWWLPAVSEVNGAVVTNLNAVNTNNALAPAMDVSKGPVGWEYVTVALKATAATEYLSFVGAGSGAPPWALLTDVSMVDPPAAPEPSTWAMMGLGFAGLGLLGWRGSRRRSAAAA